MEPWEREITERYQAQYAPSCQPWWSLICPTKRHHAMIDQLDEDITAQMQVELRSARKRHHRSAR